MRRSFSFLFFFFISLLVKPKGTEIRKGISNAEDARCGSASVPPSHFPLEGNPEVQTWGAYLGWPPVGHISYVTYLSHGTDTDNLFCFLVCILNVDQWMP